ncbi:GGDEF domain-containing response regulator [Aquicella lusitana]|uniref:diguanylate cyclase n=1 Tax=Aquicella lusitana TaxID=254246 RepID=A0A370GAF1_9COXI|nr:diguanylate cyclase [Aquicella lusitana]RDI38943.1 diguanylate cyclase (GGDEF)-like protein [Aquicella lusitana]VVC74308.1 Response regulator PleD [Aquicella lusitana]
MDNETLEKIRKLTADYATQLPAKVRKIEMDWFGVKETGSKVLLERLIKNVHSLCGTAGTYGYTLVSEAARTIEQCLRKIESEGIVNQLELDDLIQDLNQLILIPLQKSIEQAPVINLNKEARLLYFVGREQDKFNKQIEPILQFNYALKLFTSVDEFIAAVHADKPDFILIDIELATKIPIETIRQFRDELVLVVYMASEDDLATRLFNVRHGGHALVTKPIDVDALLRILDNLFEARRPQNERILIVDDSIFLANYYAILLKQAGMITAKVIDARNFLSCLLEFQPDLILMDINMPFCTGTELAQVVHQQENLSGIPIIFLSSIVEKAVQLDVLSLAGDDFLTKPIEPAHLVAAVRNRLMRSRMLRARMMRDSLTNLYNHTMIHHHLEREMLMAERYKREMCVALLDIDYFKAINDTYGHQIGDKMLKELSLFLQKKLRKSDLIGRYGGEEFLVILPNTNMEAGIAIIDNLRERFSKISHKAGNKELFITVSGGIANYPRYDKVASLVKAADDALYLAKEQGRNRIVSMA